MKFNRHKEDVGNILALEHINLTVPDQTMAMLFYVTGLGFTRDPYIDFGGFNVWVNVGNQQFHLPTASAQKLRGEVGVLVQDVESLKRRLTRLASRLEGTQFSFRETRDGLLVTCPWGNQINCRQGSGDLQLGIDYIETHALKEHLPGISRFYEQLFKAPTVLKKNSCDVLIGRQQRLRFKAVSKLAPYDGHHIAIYLVNFSDAYEQLKADKHISEESDQHQYRFTDIVDPDSGAVLMQLEHEVRSLYHPMFTRKLVNRNADQTFGRYTEGRDAFYPA